MSTKMSTSELNCIEVDALLNSYCNESLDSRQLERLEAHLASCAECSEKALKHRAYLRALESIHAPEISRNKADVMIARAISAGESREARSASWMGFAGGFIAASVMAIAIFIFGFSGLGQEAKPAGHYAFFEGDSQELIVVLNVPADMPETSLQFNLPADVAVAGYEHMQTVDWVIDLKKGANTIVLPLDIAPYVDFSQPLRVGAQLHFGDKQKVFTLEIPAPTSADGGNTSARFNIKSSLKPVTA